MGQRGRGTALPARGTARPKRTTRHSRGSSGRLLGHASAKTRKARAPCEHRGLAPHSGPAANHELTAYTRTRAPAGSVVRRVADQPSLPLSRKFPRFRDTSGYRMRIAALAGALVSFSIVSSDRRSKDHIMNWRYTFTVGFGFFGISIIWPIFNSLIPPMLEDLGLAATVIGFILTWDNIINMFVQPWVGERSDRTWTRFGRRKPWLMLGAPMAALFFILVPFVRENFLLIALAILGTNIGMALFRSPTIAYLGDLFPAEQRSKANGVINLMGGLGAAIALFAGGALYKIGVPLPFIVGAGVMLLAIIVVLLAVREPAQVESAPAEAQAGLIANLREVYRQDDRSGVMILLAIFLWFVGWNAMEAFFTLYARNVLEIDEGSATQMLTIFAATLILFAIPSGFIATRFGRRRTILVGLSGMLLGLLIGFGVRSAGVLLVVLAFMGAFWALVNINSLPIVYDVGGEARIGTYTGLYYFASSLAAISGPILAGALIDVAGHAAIWLFSAVFIGLAMMAMLALREPETMPKQVPA
ncbi:MAG: MFS transporter [Caldilineae bacterium]|nr:MAG: MFS transporter [Caldilineae bacterium]